MTHQVAAITVTFNPDPAVLERQIRSLSNSCRHILVDNGSSPESEKAIRRLAKSHGAYLIENQRNLGIAAAQNRAVRHVLENESAVEYLLFLDHDSVPAPGYIAEIQALFQSLRLIFPRSGVLGPALRDPRSGSYHGFHVMRGLLYSRQVPDVRDPTPVRCATVNSSGTFCPVEVMRDVGYFDEALFIDHVETEWCFRAADRGYELFGVGVIELEHAMGDDVVEVRLGWRRLELPYRNPLRHRYLMRNSIEMLRRSYVPITWKTYCLAKVAFTYLMFCGLAGWDREQRQAIWNGIRDGWQGELGEIQVDPVTTGTST